MVAMRALILLWGLLFAATHQIAEEPVNEVNEVLDQLVEKAAKEVFKVKVQNFIKHVASPASVLPQLTVVFSMRAIDFCTYYGPTAGVLHRISGMPRARLRQAAR
jgi:hypothetical protein